MSMQVDAPPPNEPTEKQTFHIGTRKSILARIQTDEVVRELKKAWPQYTYEVHAMATTGDNNQSTALHKFNEKALWTQELEVKLQNHELDLIVHSLKDMPTQLPHDLELGCVTKRLDARDALVVKPSLSEKHHSLADLPEGSVVGTSSLRRTAQLKRHYPHLKFSDVRGSLGTRLAKLDNPESEYSAIILATAGLLRMGMKDRITSNLSKANGGMLHAVGQGALGIETRKGDERVRVLLERIGCDRTTKAALVERSLMRTLEGGCSVPIGVETEWLPRTTGAGASGVGIGVKPSEDYDKLTGIAVANPDSSQTSHAPTTTATPSGPASGAEAAKGGNRGIDNQDSNEPQVSDEMLMRAVVVSLDGSEAAEVEARKIIRSNEDAEQFGWDVARMLVEKGADKILEAITLNRGIIREQGEA